MKGRSSLRCETSQLCYEIFENELYLGEMFLASKKYTKRQPKYT